MLKNSTRFTILEIGYSLFCLEEFHPFSYLKIVPAKNREEWLKVNNLFLMTIKYLEDHGCHINFSQEYYSEYEKVLIDNIFKADIPYYYFGNITVDISEMLIEPTDIPEDEKELFGLFNLYLHLSCGAIIDRKTIFNIIGKKYSHSGFESIKKEIFESTGKKIIKRNDNMYFFWSE